jgi:hypothetical protein
MYPITIKYTIMFHSKALQNIPKSGFLVWKYTIWQPWIGPIIFFLPTTFQKHFFKETFSDHFKVCPYQFSSKKVCSYQFCSNKICSYQFCSYKVSNKICSYHLSCNKVCLYQFRYFQQSYWLWTLALSTVHLIALFLTPMHSCNSYSR